MPHSGLAARLARGLHAAATHSACAALPLPCLRRGLSPAAATAAAARPAGELVSEGATAAAGGLAVLALGCPSGRPPAVPSAPPGEGAPEPLTAAAGPAAPALVGCGDSAPAAAMGAPTALNPVARTDMTARGGAALPTTGEALPPPGLVVLPGLMPAWRSRLCAVWSISARSSACMLGGSAAIRPLRSTRSVLSLSIHASVSSTISVCGGGSGIERKGRAFGGGGGAVQQTHGAQRGQLSTSSSADQSY